MKVKATVSVTSYQKNFLSTDYYVDDQGILRDRSRKDRALVGGYGTGKTHSLCTRILQRIQFREKQGIEHIGICTAPVHSHFVDVLVPQMEDHLKRYRFKYTYNSTDKIFRIKHGKRVHKLFLKSGEQAKKGRIVGINATDAYHDEFDVNTNEVQELLWKATEERLRDCIDPTQNIATTPEKMGYCEWLCSSSEYMSYDGRKHENKSQSKVWYIRAETKDNIFLADPEGYAEKLMSIYTPKQVEAYLKGYFVNLIGDRVWEYFDEDKHVYSDLDKDGTIVAFWDFGWRDNTYCGFASISSNRGMLGEVRILDEFRVNKTVISDVFAMYEELCKKYGRPIIDYCDPAGGQHHFGSGGAKNLSVIEQMEAYGLNPSFRRSNIIEGIVIGNNLLHKNRVSVHERCRHFIKMMINSSYEKTANGGNSEKPIHGEYEAAEAAFRYLIVGEFAENYANYRITERV